MRQKRDIIIIGGGHNGLITAAYLARAGKQVLLLERQERFGGVAVTEMFHPGYFVDSLLHEAGMLDTAVQRELYLPFHNLVTRPGPAVLFNPMPDGAGLTIWRDNDRTLAGLNRLAPAAAARYPDYRQTMKRFAGLLSELVGRIPPDPLAPGWSDAREWLGALPTLAGLGGDARYAFLRFLPMSLVEWFDEWFETPLVRATLGAAGVIGLSQGPYSGGTALNLLYHHLGAGDGLPATRQVQGGIGRVSATLAAAAEAAGATLWPETAVAQVNVLNGRSTGVTLADGRVLEAAVVVATTNPRHTFRHLVDPLHLDPVFNRAVGNIRFRGAVAKVHLALDGLPSFAGVSDPAQLTGRIQLAPSLVAIEQAYDAAKYGGMGERPFLDIRLPTIHDPTLAPPGGHVMSIWVQYAPFHLAEGRWDEERERMGDRVLAMLAEVAPDLPARVVGRELLTPADLAERFALAEGDPYHGQMMLDQLLFMRPVPGWGQYRTPIEGLYYTGAGAHPGGGVNGQAGRLAARQILRDLG